MAVQSDEQNADIRVPTEETEYEALIDGYSHFAPPHEGELLQGRVLNVTDKDVIVDFGYKSEGMVPIEQFVQPHGSTHAQRGDTTHAMVARPGVPPERHLLL